MRCLLPALVDPQVLAELLHRPFPGHVLDLGELHPGWVGNDPVDLLLGEQMGAGEVDGVPRPDRVPLVVDGFGQFVPGPLQILAIGGVEPEQNRRRDRLFVDRGADHATHVLREARPTHEAHRERDLSPFGRQNAHRPLDVEHAGRLVVGHQRVPHPDLDGGRACPRRGGEDPHHVRLGDLNGNRVNVDAVHQAGGDVGLLTGAELAHLGGLEDPPGRVV